MQTLSIRVPDDIEDDIEELAEANGNTRSDQTRQLLRAGLDREDRGDSVPIGFVLSSIGALLFGGAATTVEPAGLMASLGLLLWLGAPLLHHSKVRNTASRARRRVSDAVSLRDNAAPQEDG